MTLDAAINNPVDTLAAALKEIAALPAGERLRVSSLFGSSRAFFLASAFRALNRPVLAVLPEDGAATEFADDLRFFLGQDAVRLFPSTEVLPFEAQSAHQELTAARVEILHGLSDPAKKFITVLSAQTLMQRVMPREGLAGAEVTLLKGGAYPHEELVATLAGLGFTRMSMVEERGEMSVRGAILDIFPPGFDNPLRLEFFGDEVESIRAFDLSTQRSLGALTEVRILPAGEVSLGGHARSAARERLIERAEELDLPRSAWEALSTSLRDGVGIAGREMLLPLFYGKLDAVFDYLDSSTAVALIDAPSAEASFELFEGEVKNEAERFLTRKQFFVRPEELYLSAKEARAQIGRFAVIEVESFKSGGIELSAGSNLDVKQDMARRKGREFALKPLADRIKEGVGEGWRVYLTVHNKGQADRTKELLEAYGLKPAVLKGADILERKATEFALALGSLSTGFNASVERLVIISEEEIFGERVKRRAPSSRKLDAFLLELQDLKEGDYIVHAHHGIGLYRGMKRVGVDGIENDFLLLEYRDADKLYMPVSRMDLISKYHGVEGRGPLLDKLGSAGWGRTKGRVKKEVEKMAGELLKLYAERQASVGFAFSKPSHMFQEFEAGFEYTETPDQARAIDETLADMQEERTMDRLICGDVGYGKTEVAIRAAFKAALDNKQTAVLVPTTVLAQQHYLTFSKRFAPYPVTVGVLSRFKSKKEQKEVVEKVKTGEVDIVIGTHRLLQKDMEFKDLGLIVIDEEHRFGVKQKERFKQMRKTVDCLTLTATPIPRTLQMSLGGIRDMSIIGTPPEDRLAIKTSVIRFDEAQIAEAVEREIKRNGQVFFVHNRIQSIAALHEFLSRVVPNARVAVAHGQMKETELEKKMLGFVSREYDVLLSTAIIESGLDIPSANTIIINRADRFGLAELYQLRGRVGRSSHRAYAYFIIPEEAGLTADARRRIEVLQELTEPGSGFKIATYDLEIRGAGEFLGTSQSGHITEVGFDMYAKLLEEAVRELKGEAAPEEIEPEINLKVSQYIPEDYMPDARQRLGFYKKLASVSTEDEVIEITDELGDRFGDMPEPVDNLLQAAGLKLLLKAVRAKELAQRGGRLYIAFGEIKDAAFGRRLAEKCLSLAKKEPKRFRLTPDSRLVVFPPAGTTDISPLKEARYVLKELVAGCYI
ncbi:MAG: transcription-repair coupling factor [Deltaproteobacteria bacterium]|nr:transcription-repair coupling factor [Deltaproteobacteria bacterium]